MSASAASSLARVGEGEAGEAVLGDHHQRRAERRGMEAVADGDALAARLVVAGRHRLVGDEQIVQAAGTGEADLVAGVEDGSGIGQQAAGMVERHRLEEALRRQAGPAGEQALQRRAASGRPPRRSPRARAGRASCARDELDGAADDLVVASLRSAGIGRGVSAGDGERHRQGPRVLRCLPR